MDIAKILDEYLNGDEGKRLRLFLAFRDLRDYFSGIEQESPRRELIRFTENHALPAAS